MVVSDWCNYFQSTSLYLDIEGEPSDSSPHTHLAQKRGVVVLTNKVDSIDNIELVEEAVFNEKRPSKPRLNKLIEERQQMFEHTIYADTWLNLILHGKSMKMIY